MSIIATIPVFILNNAYALNAFMALGENAYMRFQITHEKSNWEDWAYLAAYQHDHSRPKHVFEERWRRFETIFCAPGVSYLEAALECLSADYLDEQNGRVVIKEESQFELWQNLFSRMSLLPIVEWFSESRRLARSRSCLVYPYNKRVEDYISREGLNENHLHINLCRPAEEVWLTCLYNLQDYRKEAESHAHEVGEMMRQVNPQLNAQVHIRRMIISNKLRRKILFLLDVAEHNFSDSWEARDRELLPVRIPGAADDILNQERMIWRRYYRLAHGGMQHPAYEQISSFLHLYLLLQNEFMSMARYRDSQLGLQEFCKTSAFPRPESDLCSYYKRAIRNCLHHTNPHRGNCLEVRFSPKKLEEKISCLIRSAYAAGGMPFGREANCLQHTFLSQHALPFRLILVAHLIKNRFRMRPNISKVMQYALARRSFIKDLAPLACWYQKGRSAYIPVGIDAAGNETALPIDVFVPAFRLYEHFSRDNMTFHCGEDYRHLISGMRAVYDVIHILDFRSGNRIGHAVALGVEPSLWQQSMPRMIVMEREEWLLNLIFCRFLLARNPSRFVQTIFLVEKEISKQSVYIFREEIQYLQLEAMYMARGLIPEQVSSYIDKRQAAFEKLLGFPYDARIREKRSIQEFERLRGHHVLQIFNRWNTDVDILKRRAELIEVKRDFLDAETLLHIQQTVQREVREHGIVVEILPVSNYRIGLYTDMKQHHALRWLRVPGHFHKEDVKMNVCLGSDDPGIFASDIKAEFYHLFCAMKSCGMDDDEVLSRLDELNETGRIYSFAAVKTKEPGIA